MVRETIRIRVNRSAAQAYEFLSRPENFPKWASGLGGSLRRHGADWVVETPEGRATVRFSEPNSHGVLDHQVLVPGAAPVYVPLRVVADGDACDLVLTLFRRPEMSNEKFAADAEWVMRDLQTAKRLLEHPDHRISTRPAGVRVRVTFKGEVIANSRDAILLEEAKYPPVYYIPRKHVQMERLERTAHRTHCPFKGDASYFSLKNGPDNAVWSYEQPYDEMSVIKDLLAFYPDKVEISAS
jgi:uncharacterized protein (DUF427 family)